ncbi:RNA-directed DNA polymerase, eukaryota, reverse transcriptase zinc-binding domain protein [Tanacetum coccineum]
MGNEEFRRTMEKDIEDIKIAEYMKYEAEMKRQSWRDFHSYFPTKNDNWDVGSFHFENNKTSDYPYYADDAKINAYYDLPPLLPLMSKQGMIDNTDEPDVPNLEPHDEGISSNDDLMSGLSQRQMKTSKTDTILGASSMASDDTVEKDSHPSRTLLCQLQPKDLSPGIFSLPCTISSFNLYAITDLGTCFNITPGSVFEYLKLTNLKKTDVLVRIANMTQQAPLGTVKNVLVKIDKFVFLCNFVVIDMPGILGEMMILGKPFLATIHAQIDVFNREISFGIGDDRAKFDVNGNSHHSNITLEKVYMEIKKESFNPLEIEDDNKRDTSRWHACKLGRVFYDNGSGEDCRIWPTCNPDLSFCSGYEAVYGKVKIGHTNIANSDREKIFNEWVLDSFDVEADYAKMFANPYSRRFDKYRQIFINEVEQLSNEYALKIWKKGYILDDVWEK